MQGINTQIAPVPGLESPRPAALGRVFYVDGNGGNNGNEGTDPQFPLLTILQALSLCTTWKNDYIIILDHYQETWPVTINKARVHIIGIANVGLPNLWLTKSSDTAIFEIEEDETEIAGFEFGAGASHAGIELTAALKGYGHIHDCLFGWMQTGQDGIRDVDLVDAPAMLIERCRFGNFLTRDGIRIEYNMTRGEIWNNVFRSMAGVGINILNAMALGIIGSNVFKLTGNTAGQAITIAAAAAAGELFIVDNDANYGRISMGNVPYVVTGGAGDGITWCNNRRNGSVVDVA